MLKRILFYTLGLIILTTGITLNAQSGLGINPILAMPFLATQLSGIDLAITSLILYIIFIVVQLFIYLKDSRRNELGLLILQIPVSLILTLLFDWSLKIIPNFATIDYTHQYLGYVVRFFTLVLSLILIGIGAAIMLRTNLIPTPADGIVEAFSTWSETKIGNVKNIFDITLITLTFLFAFLSNNFQTGIGIGTILGMLYVGRVMNWFEKTV